ncbi:MAG: hypothetical protein K6G18_03135 [Treponema sp.]|nr:hypothetical protein [Treponema sp.]
MPKILIFGLGTVFTEHVRQINFDDVAGLSDNSIYRVRGTMYGKYCFPPSRPSRSGSPVLGRSSSGPFPPWGP